MDERDTRDTRRKRTWRRVAVWSLILLMVMLGAAYGGKPLAALLRLMLSDPDRLRMVVVGWGPWGALVLIGLQVTQALLAPVPGHVLGLVGGYLYGPWLGTLVNMTGTMIGSGIAMGLARRFGRPLVERWVPPDWLAGLNELARRHGSTAFFLIFLFPFLPDDAACFVAGLSPLPLGELLLLALLGRLPGVFIPNWLGAHATDLNARQWIAIILLMVPIAVAFWRWQASIERFMFRLFDRLPGRK
jgi:uncharacterized membrane protein YdjX (TVP38/TMEM64 family)